MILKVKLVVTKHPFFKHMHDDKYIYIWFTYDNEILR